MYAKWTLNLYLSCLSFPSARMTAMNHHHTQTQEPLWMSEDNLQALVLSIYMWVLELNLDFRLGTISSAL